MSNTAEYEGPMPPSKAGIYPEMTSSETRFSASRRNPALICSMKVSVSLGSWKSSISLSCVNEARRQLRNSRMFQARTRCIFQRFSASRMNSGSSYVLSSADLLEWSECSVGLPIQLRISIGSATFRLYPLL